MGTRSIIKVEGINYAQIYMHWDGYPDHGYSLEEAQLEVARWYRHQAEMWEDGTHPDLQYELEWENYSDSEEFYENDY